MIREIGIYAIGSILTAIFSFISVPLLSYFFSSEQLGQFSLFQVSVSMIALAVGLGLTQAYVREFNEVKCTSNLFFNTLWPQIISCLVISFLIFIIWYFIADFHSLISMWVLINGLLSVVFLAFNNHCIHWVRMLQNGKMFAFTQVLPKFLFLLLILITLFGSLSHELTNILGAFTLSQFILSVFFVYAARSVWARELRVEVDSVRFYLGYSLNLVLASGAYFALLAADKYMIGSLSSLSELGVYALAASIGSATTIISNLFVTLWHPKFYNWYKNGFSENVFNLFIRLVSLFVFLIWSLIGMLSNTVDYFLRDEYVGVGALVTSLSSLSLIYLISEVTKVGINISRKTHFSTLSALLALVLNVTLNFTLIESFGAKGAAVSSVLSFFLLLILRTELSALFLSGIVRLNLYACIMAYIFVTFINLTLDLGGLQSALSWGGAFITSILLLYSKDFKSCRVIFSS